MYINVPECLKQSASSFLDTPGSVHFQANCTHAEQRHSTCSMRHQPGRTPSANRELNTGSPPSMVASASLAWGLSPPSSPPPPREPLDPRVQSTRGS